MKSVVLALMLTAAVALAQVEQGVITGAVKD